MKITLAVCETRDHDLEGNFQRMADFVSANKDADLIIFGESYLTGFDSINFNYEHDIEIALPVRSAEITRIRKLAKAQSTAIGFGFIENHRGSIYSSYLILDKNGEIADLYRRRSVGWKIPGACADYREGQDFHKFTLAGKKFAVMVCGDFWTDDLLSDLVDLDPTVDAFLWPSHCSIDLTRDTVDRRDYQERSAILAKPLLFISNYHEIETEKYAAAFVWQQGVELAAYDSLEPGKLEFVL